VLDFVIHYQKAFLNSKLREVQSRLRNPEQKVANKFKIIYKLQPEYTITQRRFSCEKGRTNSVFVFAQCLDRIQIATFTAVFLHVNPEEKYEKHIVC
jgi:hypothetical protein